MNAFLEQFSWELPGDARGDGADRAGWHVSRDLRILGNVTLVHLLPKSPELNPTENLWHYPQLPLGQPALRDVGRF